MRHVTQGMVFAVAVSSGALFGCSAAGSPSSAAAAATPPPSSIRFGEFTAHVNKKARTMTIQRVDGGRARGSDLQPESVDDLTIGNGGSSSADTVDLDTVSVADGYPDQTTFSAVVDLRHFFARSFANVYVQVTSVTDAMGNATDWYDATNSDDGSVLDLDNTHGLWQYTAAGAPAGVLTQAPSNWGERTWIFNNPDDNDCTYTFAVWASMGFADYTFSFPNMGYTDVCSGGTAILGPDDEVAPGTPTSSTTAVALPFDFTLYNTNSSTVNIGVNGQITLGDATPTASGTSVALPSASAPQPAFFPFWDDLSFGSSGQICYQTLGTAPSRMFAIEWRGMTFAGGPGSSPPSSLDFVTYLYEGTSEIDTYYNSMVGGAGSGGRETGTTATVGMQDETGTVSTSEHDVADYGTGSGWSYIPNPF
jgi:hypothetical protein